MIEFSGVSKTYNKNFDALKNINLSINDGEFVFVVGASGAGKSTFLKLIMREEIPSSGTVTINGYNLNRMKKRDIPYFRRTLGIVFQDFRLIPDMKVYDNVAFALRVTGTKEREVRKRVTHALGMVGLLSKTQSFPKELSGGEQQRAAIARALVNNADLIIADEPTGNIDPAMSIEIVDLLNHINKANGATVVMVTHAHDLVKQYDHRIVVLKDGEIVADGHDKNKTLSFVNPEIVGSDGGFYNAPNEYQDVERFIVTYGKKEASLAETLPLATIDTSKKEDARVKKADFLPDSTPASKVIESIMSEVKSDSGKTKERDKPDESEKNEQEAPIIEPPYVVKNDEFINDILSSFAQDSEKRHKRAEELKNKEKSKESLDNKNSASGENNGENGGGAE